MTSHKKSETQNQKKNIFSLQTCQVFGGFEKLCSTIGVRAMDLQRHVQTA